MKKIKQYINEELGVNDSVAAEAGGVYVRLFLNTLSFAEQC